ncbi:TrbG/VirB9 family P-type conjugative transfer protein [Ahrensia sp. 13_GOM-1096m]|uniref:TrbG/VirB9 family P-type conjugative transfer protein n=1 Tax=Ahrensia sp. 13_GOM-1096m TaxID=1380380 RepID=UPI000683F99D|nr:TrbG/VirB9 family P-type conjugative transfer protein [Ahrensia sp. 13_GOM-1096m]
MRYKLLTAILLSALALPISAFAEQRPTPLPADGRIKQFVYNENTVYRLDMHTNFISTVQFGKSEVVESIQVGDSASWQIIRLKRGDVISIKPLNNDAITNMTVYTDRRVYSFELRAHRGAAGHHKNHNFRTTFKYPTAVVSEYSGSQSKRGRNFDYRLAGKSTFAPIEVFDNGKQTFFTFPDAGPLPAIFRVGKGGKEYIVNSRTSGRQIIVDGVNELWTVRIGKEAICVANGPVRVRNILG